MKNSNSSSSKNNNLSSISNSRDKSEEWLNSGFDLKLSPEERSKSSKS